MSEQHIDGWYFAPQRRVQLPDTFPFISTGWTYRADDPDEMRRRRFLAWGSPVFAFLHTGGVTACRVSVSGLLHAEQNQPLFKGSSITASAWYGTRFTIQWLGRATHLLQLFLCDLAEQALAQERAADREYEPRIHDFIALRRLAIVDMRYRDAYKRMWRQQTSERWLYPSHPPQRMIVYSALGPFFIGDGYRGLATQRQGLKSGLIAALMMDGGVDRELEQRITDAFAPEKER